MCVFAAPCGSIRRLQEQAHQRNPPLWQSDEPEAARAAAPALFRGHEAEGGCKDVTISIILNPNSHSHVSPL